MNRHKNISKDISKDISIIKEQSHIKLTKYIETMCPNGHYNKAHAMLAIRAELETDNCFLVDDIIQSQFEEKKMGICIPGGEFYILPEEETI